MRSASKAGPRAFLLAILLGGASFVAPPSRAETGGPDAYGYVWVDSRAPSPIVPFSWIDITGSGSRIALGGVDDCSFEIGIGFNFRFYGTIVNQIFVCSDGFVSFSQQGFNASAGFGDGTTPNDRIVGLGMDLVPVTSGSDGLYVLSQDTTTPKRFIVTWNNAYTKFTAEQQTFQIILEQNHTSRDGRIFIQYQSLTNAAAGLIGIEDSMGASGLQYPFPATNGLAVAFLPPSDANLPPDVLTVVPSILAPGSVAQGTPNVPMMQLDLLTSTNDILVSEIEVQLSGLGAGPEDVPLAAIWYDQDENGEFSPSFDRLLRTAVMGGSPTTARLALSPSVVVSMSSVVRLFLSYDIAPGANIGDWVGARISAPAKISVEFPDRVATAGFPMESYSPDVRTQIDSSVDTLALLSASDRVPQNGTQWETDLPLMSLQLGALTNEVDLAGVTIEVGGNAVEGDVWRVKALEDVDRDGGYGPAIDTVLAVAAPSGIPLAATLTFSRTVVAGRPFDLLLLFDIGPEAVPGSVANFTLNVTGIHLAVGSADLLSPSNLPVTTNPVTIGVGLRPTLSPAFPTVSPSADGVWNPNEYVLGPGNTDVIDPPAGNRIAGYVTVENNESMLFVAIDATGDSSSSLEDGVAIGFDTNADGAPTNGSDDVFVAIATGGARFLYNDTAGSWVMNETCGSTGGNDTTPACAPGFGATELSGTYHRFYEFAIPLTLLGVAVPVGPGTVLRFAIAAPPLDGLRGDSGRSTWPILFDPLPALRHFADLHLMSAPRPNSPPTLDWTAEPGYVSDGLEPETGLRDLEFVWRVRYTDAEDDPPALSQPRLKVLRDGIQITGSPFPMSEDDPSDTNHTDGKVYSHRVRLSLCQGNFSYEFSARDGANGVAIPISGTGPVVICPNLPPLLVFPQVSPPIGLSGTVFQFRIGYADPEGVNASFVEATVEFDGTDLPTFPLAQVGWIGSEGSYAQGAWYEGYAPLSQVGTGYRYRFRTSDGNTTVNAGPFFGPQVLAQPPDILRVASSNLAPLVADEGDRLVEFLHVILYTSDPEVNVTSIRFDRIGSSADTDVQEVLLYEDLDPFGLDVGDDLLGARSLQIGFVEFDFVPNLRVTPSNAIALLVVANLTTPGTADAAVGFELSSADSIGVGSGDIVTPVTARSTRTLVNVRPRVNGITVDGWAAGSPQVAHVTQATPLIGWRFEDNNTADLVQQGYNVSVWSVSPPAFLWSETDITANSSTTYAGPALLPGETYRVEVRVYDDRLWSGVWSIAFRRNTPPVPVVLLHPNDFSTDVPTTVTLSWEAATDAEGDSVRYYSWASDNPGFASPIANVTVGTEVTLVLPEGTEYFWKVGASDGYEFTSGNATVWRFTTFSSVAPILGDIQGRVINGSSSLPIAGALVELLNGTTVRDGMVTGDDGRFGFTDLDLAPYMIRVSAFGFVSQSRPAEPTQEDPSVDVGDIALALAGPHVGGDEPAELPWLPFLLALVGVGVLLVIVSRRRRSEEKPKEEGDSSAVGWSASAGASTPRAEVAPPSPLPSKTEVITPSTAGMQFECPICGRRVAANATICECGALFEN